MEETSKEEMGEIISTKASVADISVTYPCSLINEAIKALLKCLGFEYSSSPVSYTDPPSSTTTPTSTSVADRAKTLRAKNRRPPVKPGRGPPQNNSIPSS